jgi:hypothetical protein
LARCNIAPFQRQKIRGKVRFHRTDRNEEATLMKKPTAKIREEIARLQEQLKQAETRDAERIGRIALRAGIGEIETEEAELLSAFEEVASRFRGDTKPAHGRKSATTPPNATGEAASQSAEA